MKDCRTIVEANTINIFAQVDIGGGFASFGIGAMDINNTSNHLTIEQNTITLDNIINSTSIFPADGIRLITTTGRVNYVEDNEITFNEPDYTAARPPYGIWLQDSQGNHIKGNTIENYVGTLGYVPNDHDQIYGIMTENSPDNQVFQNVTENMGSGIAGKWTCTNTLYYCNNVRDSWDGFHFYNAVIPDQYGATDGTGNCWDAAWGCTGSSTMNVNGDVVGDVSPSIAWNYDSNYTPSFTSTTIIPNGPVTGIGCDEDGHSPEERREMMLGKIVRGDNTYDTLEAEFKLKDSIFAYHQLYVYDTLMSLGTDEDTLYQNFYDFCADRNIGQFEDVNNFIIDSVLGSLDDAKATNENIETTCAIEDNQKLVNEIYINKLLYESDTLNGVGAHYEFDTTEIQQLEGVAYQNPALGGKAVYLARILLWKDVMDDYSTEVRRAIHNNAAKRQTIFKLFPNPNDGKMQFLYSLANNETGMIKIFDLLGKEISSYYLLNGSTTLNIEERNLNSGIYFYKIIINGNVVKSDKLIIVH